MVSVYDVYSTVQTIINKENRGYLTKDEFNRLAAQAQLEIFEGYFADKNRSEALGENSDDYADIAKNVEEKLTFFDNTYQYTDAERVKLGHATGTNISNYFGFEYPPLFYRLGQLQVDDSAGVPIIVDEVSHKDLAYIRRSNLTAPTATQPVYVRHEGGVRIFPQSIQGSVVEMIYVRKPIDPELRGTVVSSQFVPAADSVNFEVHASEQQELVAKILTYAGVVIRQPEITQIGSQKEQQIKGLEG